MRHTCYACQRGLRAHVQNTWRLLIFTCQRANDVPIVQLCLPKGVPIFQLFFKRIFQFLNFSIMLNNCKFQEYLGNSRKIMSVNKEFKFWHLQNFIKEKLVSLKPLTSFSMNCVGLTEQIIRLVQKGAEYIFFTYLTLYAMKSIHHAHLNLVGKTYIMYVYYETTVLQELQYSKT